MTRLRPYLCHLDTVRSSPGDRTVDPFRSYGERRLLYGRGTAEMKGRTRPYDKPHFAKAEKIEPARRSIQYLPRTKRPAEVRTVPRGSSTPVVTFMMQV